MAKHYLEQVVGRSIAGAQTEIMALRSTVAGTLEKVTVYTKANVASMQTFDVNHGTHAGDLATVFPTSGDRPSITSGNHSDEATPTNRVTLAVGDLLTVDADVVNEAFELATVVFQIEDGAEQGVGILARPGASNPEDEEFEGTALDTTKWTKTNSAAVESYNGKVRSAYWFYQNAGASRVMLEQSYANASDFSATLCFSCPLLSNFNGVYLTIQDASGNNFIQMQYLSNTGLKIRVNKRISGTYTFDIATAAIVNVNYPIGFLHIQRSTNNWLCYYSNDGFVWTLLSTVAVTMTVGKFLLEVAPADATNKTITALHWFRRDWLTL